MASYEAAVEVTDKGFHIFPIIRGAKAPPVQKGKFKDYATRDTKILSNWWIDPVTGKDRDYNIGISTDLFADKEALIVVDIDVKGDKNGMETWKKLEAQGFHFPQTFTQKTPSGGYHLFYRTTEAVRQGAEVLGDGMDIRSRGGYVVGPGSKLNGLDQPYLALKQTQNLPTVAAPSWMEERLKIIPTTTPNENDKKDTEGLFVEGIKSYLKRAPEATQGNRDDTAYKVACQLKNLGADQIQCFDFMTPWNDEKCHPPLEDGELRRQIECAFSYSRSGKGSATPQAHFEEVEVKEDKKGKRKQAKELKRLERKKYVSEADAAVQKLNKDHTLVIISGKPAVIRETTDEKGRDELIFMGLTAFRTYNANKTIRGEKRPHPVSEIWLAHKDRATKDKLVFAPGVNVPDRFYNLWRGFIFKPTTGAPNQQQVDAVEAFKEHLFENVCDKDQSLADWLTTFFAHLIQKPGEKPQVAVVMSGEKGTGKDALIDRVGALIDPHYLMVAQRRYLTSNFNSHFERCLMVVFNEAFWSGNKDVEGTLKDLITGKKHSIERKGFEPYDVDSFLRVVVMGNEEWLVPATRDERRFAVFNVNNNRQRDNVFFKTMRLNMEAGGYRYLLRYLIDYDISKTDIEHAPKSKGLMHQKIETLDLFETWWRQSLYDGKIVNFSTEGWPTEITADEVKDCFYKQCQEKNIRSRFLSKNAIGRKLKRYTPLFPVRITGEGRYYRVSSLEECRKKWEEVSNIKENWDEDD